MPDYTNCKFLFTLYMKQLLQNFLERKRIWFSFFIAFFSFTAAQAQYNVVVAKDGSGAYTTLQAAVNAAPSNATTPYKILVKKGKYVEKVTIPANKPFLQIFGEGVNE